MIWNSRFVLSEPSDYDLFSRNPDINNGVSSHTEVIVSISKVKN